MGKPACSGLGGAEVTVTPPPSAPPELQASLAQPGVLQGSSAAELRPLICGENCPGLLTVCATTWGKPSHSYCPAVSGPTQLEPGGWAFEGLQLPSL